MNRLQNSQLFNNMLTAGQLDILAVYPDEDFSVWQEHKNDIPSRWINARDEKQVINKGQLYDLKAIPSLYLRDRDKIVLLKDTDAETVERYLEITR